MDCRTTKEDEVRRLIIGLGLVAALSGTAASGAWAADPHSPGATGQPGTNAGVTCGVTSNATSQPNGLTTSAFLNTASQQYAGSALNPNAGNTSKAVSEYDVACLQQTANGH
jgi:hypothetical protein